jgi:hypothetical protein
MTMLNLDNEKIREEVLRSLVNISNACDCCVLQEANLHHQLMALIRISSIPLVEDVSLF